MFKRILKAITGVLDREQELQGEACAKKLITAGYEPFQLCNFHLILVEIQGHTCFSKGFMRVVNQRRLDLKMQEAAQSTLRKGLHN